MEPPSTGATAGLDPVAGLLLAALLIVLNGFFVAAEFALVKARHDRLEERAKSGAFAKLALRLARRLDHSLSVAQLGITLASLALGWVGEPAVAALIRPGLAGLGFGEGVIEALAFALAFGGITTLHIVIGEQVPKLVAIAEPERVTVIVAPGMQAFATLAAPFVWLLRTLSGTITRLLGLRDIGEGEAARTDRELRYLLARSGEAGALDEVEQELAERSVGLGALNLGDIMVPRVTMEAIDIEAPLEDARATALAGHDWLPVYGEDLDDIRGAVEWRTLFGPDAANWTTLVSPVLFLPESMAVSDGLERMHEAAATLAVVIDEHGGVAGIITPTTLFETLTRPAPDLGEAPVEVDGALAVHLLEEMLGEDLPDEASTVGGLITALLGRFASAGDEVSVPGGRLRVLTLGDHGTVTRAEVVRVARKD